MSFNVDQLKSPIGANKVSGNDGKNSTFFPKTNPIRPDSFEKSGVQKHIVLPSKFQQKFLEVTNPALLYQSYLNEDMVRTLIKNNPGVSEMLANNALPCEPTIGNLEVLQDSHINPTVNYAMGIADALNLSQQDKNIIQKGALFHDFGKVLIPAEVLQKTDKLVMREKQIIDLHSKLGYELLKSSPLSKNVLQIVRDHHKPFYKKPDYRTQIVTVADVYSALVSERPYKQAYTHRQAMQVLKNCADKGQLNPVVIQALENHVTAQEAQLVS